MKQGDEIKRVLKIYHDRDELKNMTPIQLCLVLADHQVYISPISAECILIDYRDKGSIYGLTKGDSK